MSIHRDIDAELRCHFDARIEALMAEGLSRAEAERRAHDEFGDVDSVRHGLREIDRRVARRRTRLEFLNRSEIPLGITIFVSPSYFATTGTRLVRGRTFTAADTNAPFEVIVDQTMADALWPNDDPMHHCLYFRKTKDRCVPVIGVAQSTQEEMLTDKLRPHFYLSLEKPPIPEPGVDAVILRVSPTKRAAVMRSLHDILVAEFPGGIPSIETMSDMMEPAYRPWRLGAELFTLFGVLALVVAGVGIYSSVSYAVGQRTHEFGVRVALGARTEDVMQQVLGEGLRTVVVGVVIGILMALAAGRMSASLLYGIASSDPVPLALVAIVLLGIASAAAFAPAWRAAKADPVDALRAD